MNNGIVSSVLMCHAPIVIPELTQKAQEERAASSETTQSMSLAARHIVEKKPDLLVVISPHTPRLRNTFGVISGTSLYGDLGKFGYESIYINLPCGLESLPNLSTEFETFMNEKDISIQELPKQDLDHGAFVPLYFLVKEGWRGPTLVISLPYFEQEEEAIELEIKFGRALAYLAQKRNEKWVILASGDMSHRTKRGAPAGYHPKAHEFDRDFVSLIREGKDIEALHLPAELREIAAEDVVDSVAVAVGGMSDRQHRNILSYAAPFGVGYCVAILEDH